MGSQLPKQNSDIAEFLGWTAIIVVAVVFAAVWFS